MNLKFFSNSLFFIGPASNVFKFRDPNQNIDIFNRLNVSLSPRIYIPTQKQINRYPVDDTLSRLRKNNEDSSNLVTYTGSGLGFGDVVKIPSNEELISSICNSKPLVNTLARVFAREGFSKLNEYQKTLFDEMALERDVIIHSFTSSGKTYSILLYLVLRYYYQFYPQCLSSKAFSEILNHIKGVESPNTSKFKMNNGPVNTRVLILCPTKELAVQCAKQIVSFTDGREDLVHLIIDEHDLCPQINPEKIFIVGSSNQVESYFLNKDEKHTRSILQSFDYVFLDEMDRLIKVPNQYAPERKKRLIYEKPGSAFNICQSLLAISPNKLRFVFASASVSRHHIRRINNLFQQYRNNRNILTAVIRKKASATDTGRYVTIPETVEHFYATCKKETLVNKIKALVKILKRDTGSSIIFLNSGSLLTLRDELSKHGYECKILHHEFGIKDVIKDENKDDREKGSTKALEMITNLQDSIKEEKPKYILAASTDSARGIHLPILDTVYILGRPRNVNEYIHIAGRVGRCSRSGRCITIDTEDRIKILLSWQKQTNTQIHKIFEKNTSTITNSVSE